MTQGVRLENVRGIKELEFGLPEKQGVYLITGQNGCGKTTLFTVLHRIGDQNAFKNSWKSIKHPSDPSRTIDDFSEARIHYIHDSIDVTYSRGGKTKWAATPKKDALRVKPFKFKSVVYIKASNARFFQQDSASVKGTKVKKAESVISDGLNDIFETERFKNLYVRNANTTRGRSSRKNQLYVIRDGKEYSEISFSLGELIVLNVLEAISKIQRDSLLLIDEIELALHPRAQIRLYMRLNQLAEERHLTVLISTHSPSLIHVCPNIFFLDRKADGTVEVVEHCSPSYILKDLSVGLDVIPDAIIVVEDTMAHTYLNQIYKKIRADEPKINRADIKILEGGGFKNVVTLAEQMSKIKPYERKHIKALLDKDAEQTIKNTLEDPLKSISTKDLFTRNKDLTDYLDITPEEGLWEWLRDKDKFSLMINAIRSKSASFSPMWDYSTIAGEDRDCENPRATAKKRIWSVVEKIRKDCGEFRDDWQIYEIIFDAYVEDRFKEEELENRYKDLFCKLI